MAEYAGEDSSESGESDEDIISEARECLKDCIDREDLERKKMMDDLRFCTLDQWPESIRNDRENDNENGPRPCLTIDKINQYIVQVVNDMRQGKPGINVRPQDDEADVETAKILKGLIRNIEDQSNADIAYSGGGESAAKIGLGFWRVVAEYISPDSFDQDLFIRPIPNTFACYLGKHHMPDGSDAREGFILETLKVDEFKEQYPKAKWEAGDFDHLGENLGTWRTNETVTIVEYYCIERTQDDLYFLADGTTMLKSDYDKWPKEAGDPLPIQDKRRSFREQLKWRKMTGVEILESRDLPGKFIPIIEVVGREANVEGQRILWGLVRPAKDSLRMYNYWMSTLTEKMALAPKNPWVAAEGQIEGREMEWKSSNKSNRAVLQYKPIDVAGNQVPAPQRVGPTPMEAALFNVMPHIEHDVQTSLGMFKAAVGETESQQSGRAILALQRESDTGTYHFGANLGVSIRHTGRILIDLIPHYYDTKRVIRILGEDGMPQAVHIDPEQPQAKQENQDISGAVQKIYNPSIGRYDISITVGPSYNTKRMEAAATFVEMAKGAADPASAAILRYLVMRNSDSSGSDEAAKLLKTLLPPPALQALDTNEPIPPKVMAQMQQMGQQMKMMQEEGQKLQQENMQLKAGIPEAQIKADADKQIASLRAQVEAQSASMQAQEAARQRAFDDREAARQLAFDRWEALLKARTDIQTSAISDAAKVHIAHTAAATQRHVAEQSAKSQESAHTQ